MVDFPFAMLVYRRVCRFWPFPPTSRDSSSAPWWAVVHHPGLPPAALEFSREINWDDLVRLGLVATTGMILQVHDTNQLMVNLWFGAFGGLDSKSNPRKWKGFFYLRAPLRIPNHRAPNQQLTISWGNLPPNKKNKECHLQVSFEPQKKNSYFPLNPGCLMTGSLRHGLL